MVSSAERFRVQSKLYLKKGSVALNDAGSAALQLDFHVDF